MKTRAKLVATIVVGCGALLGAQAARADQAPVMVAGPTASEATTRAEALEQEARELFAQPERYKKAASLLEDAAAERQLGDPERIRDLHYAARLLFYRGDECKALRLMVQAADESLAVGDVIAAAHHYADAALLAKDADKCAEALELAKRSALLANSPLINAKERSRILSRIQAAA